MSRLLASDDLIRSTGVSTQAVPATTVKTASTESFGDGLSPVTGSSDGCTAAVRVALVEARVATDLVVDRSVRHEPLAVNLDSMTRPPQGLA